MSVLKTLRERVAPELNHLYTTPPADVAGRLDFGWHAHEHAFHTFLVARMFGAPAEICLGDFAVLSRFVPPLTSMGSGHDHAWCAVNEVAPIDLSLNFLQYGTAPQLRGPIVGEGRNGDWQVQYAYDESPLDQNIQNANEIIYIEKMIREESATVLIKDPTLFLPAPPSGDEKSWATVHGPGIHAQITLHCFQCATGEAKSIRHRLGREDAVAWIAANYPEAAKRIGNKLRE